MARSVAILCFHRVLPRSRRYGSDEPYFLRHTALELDRFVALLDALCARCNMMAPEDLLRLTTDTEVGERPSVGLTFDDGYADVLEYALPELLRRGLRAVACITSAVSAGDQPGFLVDTWYGVLATATRMRGTLEGFGTGSWAFDLSRPGDRERLIDGPEKGCYLRAATVQRGALLARLSIALGSTGAVTRPRTLVAEELHELARAGWLIASHGRTHALLPELSPTEALEELITSRDWLVGQGLPAPAIVAYPDGATSSAAEQLASQAGYQVGLALGSRLVCADDSPFHLPRLIVKNEEDWLERRLLPLLAAPSH